MLDIAFIKENTKELKEAINLKNIDLSLDELLEVYAKRLTLQQEIEKINQERNALAAKGKKGKPSVEAIEKGKALKEQLAEKEKEFAPLDEHYADLMVKVPTIPSADTPRGKDESENKIVHTWGEPTKFDFAPKDHVQIAQNLDLLDFERGVKVSGYRGYYVKNEAVQLQMGLMMFALQKAIEKGYQPMIPPTLVREFALFGTGYFAGREYDAEVDEIYKVANRDKEADGGDAKESKFLIGTAEPSLLAYYTNEVLDAKDLPLKLCGFSPCYRSEIGSYGRDTKGLFRVHEFMKIELVTIAPADIAQSDKLQDEMLELSQELHEALELPYQKLQICTGDLSAGKRRQFDLEVWIPSRDGYGETGSASNFLDWQARRLNVKYKTQAGDRAYPFMLNNTAIPSPRILIAILENYQQADGSVRVPDILQPYVGKDTITPRA